MMAMKRSVQDENPICMIILGCPGSGKGTQAQMLKNALDDVEIISTGTLLSQHREMNTTIGRFVKENWGMNNLHDVALELAKEKILECKKQNRGIIMEGFPRTVEALLNLENFLSHQGIAVDLVFELQVDVNSIEDQETIRKRIEGRKVHIPSGRVYHDEFNPPKSQDKDDITGGELSSRHDDVQSALQTRLKSFSDHTLGVLKYYRDRGILHSMDAKKPFQKIHKEIFELITQHQQSSNKKMKTLDNNNNNNDLPIQDQEFSSPLLKLFATPIGLLDSLELRETVARLSRSQKISSFPGMNSVPLDHSSIESIRYPHTNENDNQNDSEGTSHYKVSAKLDGVRYLMLVHAGSVYLMDRKMHFYQCSKLAFSKQADDSLMDGELVMDTVQQIPVFVIFDAISFHGKPLLNSKLDYRLKSAKTLLGHQTQKEEALPRLQLQPYYEVDAVPTLLELYKGKPSSEHPFAVDGIIFIPSKGKYRSGVNSKFFKWKPESKITIDFLIKSDTKFTTTIDEQEFTFYQLHIQYGSEISFYDWISFPSKDKVELTGDQVAECYWDFGIQSYVPSADWLSWEARSGGWVLDRIRVDKFHPNPQWVVDNLVAYINNPVTEEKLLSAFGGHSTPFTETSNINIEST